MILIVDMNFKKNSLAFSEFVLPIARIVSPIEEYEAKHYSEVGSVEKYSKIILSGTTLKDMQFSRDLEKFAWIKECKKPILGICAGMQVIGLVFGSKLSKCQEIGMKEIETTKENIMFSSKFKAYELHNFSIKPSDDFFALAKSDKSIQSIKHKKKDVYGVMFHPEVRNNDMIERFVQYFFR
jgi:GMP synthase-like glutamine amidotransferase